MKRIGLSLMAILLVAFQLFSQIINVPADQPSIQAGIDAATDGDTVLVADSTYYENINFNGKAITVASHFLMDEDTSHISKTIINGSQSTNPDTASVVTLWSGEDTTSVLTGFTITGGMGTILGVGDNSSRNGAGVYMNNSGGKITHNIIEDNHLVTPPGVVFAVGCGIFAEATNDAPVVIRGNIIQNNSANGKSIWGVGINCTGVAVIIEHNTIVNNEANSEGQIWGTGIVFHNASEPFLKIEKVIIGNNIVSENRGVVGEEGLYVGGGMRLQGPYFGMYEIYNNLISGHHAIIAGGLSIDSWGSSGTYDLRIYNNTIINNEASWYGNCMDIGYARITMYNNIFWSYAETLVSDFYFPWDDGYSVNAYHNILKSPFRPNVLVQEKGNTYLEPLFEGDTYMHALNSPAIGRGVDSVQIDGTWYYAPQTGIDGKDRPNGIDPYGDLGAYESEYNRVLLSNVKVLDIKHLEYNLSPEFHVDSMFYSLEVTDTCTTVSDFQAIPEDGLADIQIDPASDITSENAEDRTTTIRVTSSDGSAEKRYKMEFDALSTDATLGSLVVDTFTLYPEFSADILEYEVYIPDTTTVAPEVTAVPSSEYAEEPKIYNATLADESHMTTTIVITPEAGRKYNRTYKVVFSWVITDVPELSKNPGLSLYPNPFSSFATLQIDDQIAVEKITLTNILGKTVKTIKHVEGNTIEIQKGKLPPGLYFLQVHADELYVIKVLIR